MNLAIVTPVFNDWDSLLRLIAEIDSAMVGRGQHISLLIVNDGSTQPAPPLPLGPLSAISRVECLNLVTNQGHQRAIAIGLVIAQQRSDFDAVIVMDCDGEDQPAYLPELLALMESHPGHFVVAERRWRSESPVFRFSYESYKILFWLLTGRVINFGNFCVIPTALLDALIYQPALWNHLAATIRRSRFPLVALQTRRGQRYFGVSRMNFTALFLHGLSAISVYLDIVAARLLLASTGIAGLALAGIAAALIAGTFSPLAIPPWVTTLVSVLVIVLLQTILFSGVTVFTVLNARSIPEVIPAFDVLRLVRSQQRWYPDA